MEYLPQDTILEIVSRLPVKDLVRFSFASKRWKTIIHSKDFIRKHRQRSNINPMNDFTLIRHGVESDFHHFYSVTFSGHDHNHHTALKEEQLKHPLYSLEERDRLGVNSSIVAACNGLILLRLGFNNRHDFGLYLWNPNILKHKCIFITFGWTTQLEQYRLHGLGYDSVEDDFKVLILTESHDAETEMRNLMVCRPMPKPTMDLVVYSLASNRWKKIEKLPPSNLGINVTYRSNMVSLNDSRVAWLMRDNDRNDEYMVVTFDLVKEDYLVFPAPILVRGPGTAKLMAFGDFLCFLRCYTPDDFSTGELIIRVWFTKGCDSCWSSEPVVLDRQPLFFDGERFLLNQLSDDGNDRLIWYNIKKQEYEYGAETRRCTRNDRFTKTTICAGNLSLLLDARPYGGSSFFVM